ncbi:hypothetical protein [Mammaliicoccus phage vB_MscM-PMS3]|nr:hypothetical protein [Mammaliicoccus phage vB_MscM-PMS3]WBF82132.1 hypothetical protein [Mammaliicoccus virus vB_MscM-PMS2]
MYNEMGMFKVNIDEYELLIVAKNKEQAEKLCFDMFDFDKIDTKYMGETDSEVAHYPTVLNIWVR